MLFGQQLAEFIVMGERHNSRKCLIGCKFIKHLESRMSHNHFLLFPENVKLYNTIKNTHKTISARHM